MKDVEMAICDNEKLSLIYIKKVIEGEFLRYGISVEVSPFVSVSAFQQELKEKNFSVCFLDIDMPERNGIELAEQISLEYPNSLIVFVSGKEEYVFQSFRVHPFSFVRKAKFHEDIKQTVKDITKILLNREKQMVCKVNDELGYRYSFSVDSLIYMETKDKYVRIVTAEGEKLIRCSLKSLEKSLEPYGLIRCHKSYIVNVRKIHAVRHDKVILLDKTELPLRRGTALRLKKELCNYLFN